MRMVRIKRGGYLIFLVGFGLIPVAISVLVLHQKRCPPVEHRLFTLNVLAVQVVSAEKVAQATLHPFFNQILKNKPQYLQCINARTFHLTATVKTNKNIFIQKVVYN